MLRSVARFPHYPLSSRPVYVEEAFGVDPTGVRDSTAEWIEAAASGRTLKQFEGAIYRLSDEIPILNATRIIGDGSQTFRQYTAGYGVFKTRTGAGDGAELADVTCQYMLDRSAGPGSLTADGLSSFQRNSAFWAEASHLRIKRVRAVNFFTGVAMRGPVETQPLAITGATQTNPVQLTVPNHGLVTGIRMAPISGVGGMVQLNGLIGTITPTGTNTLTLDIDASGFSAYTSGGFLNIYDWTSYAEDIEISGLRCDTVDFGVTGSQYDRFLIERLHVENQTNYTVPPHWIYLQNAGWPDSIYEGYVRNGLIRDIHGTNTAVLGQPLLKYSNIKDTTQEACDAHGCAGFLWSRAYRCRQVSSNAIDIPEDLKGTDFTDIGEGNEVVGGLMSAATDASIAFGVVTEDDVVGTKVIGTTYQDDTALGEGRAAGFRAQQNSTMHLVGVVGIRKQAGTTPNYLVGASDSASITGTIARNSGSPGLIRIGTGASGSIQFDSMLCPEFTATGTASINNAGTLTWKTLTGERPGRFNASNPTIQGATVAGSNTYGPATSFSLQYRVGSVARIVVRQLLTSLDGVTVTGITQDNPGVVTAVGHGFSTGKVTALQGVVGMTEINGQLLTITVIDPDTFSVGIDTSGYTAYSSGGKATRMEGTITGGTLPYNVAGGASGGGNQTNTLFECHPATGLQGLPANHAGVRAELLEGTKTWRYVYVVPSATGQTRVALTAANFTDSTDLGWAGDFYTSDPP